jgi:peptidoglycan hydrolase-like protein with peptidoglycan-binding domain
MSAIENAAARNGYIVEAFSGKNARSTGTTHHPSGRAADIRIIDPATGQPLGGDASPNMQPGLFRQYEAFANDVHDEFVAANPERANDFRWGGYFVQGTPMDLMHFDVSGGGMAAGNFKTGLSPAYARAWGVSGASPSPVNPQVAALQQRLNAQGANLAVDGIMGPRTRAAIAAYAPTATNTTPTLQAVTQQATGGRSGGTISSRGPQVAQMQNYLNSLGANLKVDGLEGPLTRAAQQQFLGSPTSVRTPSITAPRPSYPSSGTQDEGRGLPQIAAPKTPAFQNPYSMSTGGANAVNPRQAPTVAVQSAVKSKTPLPGYYDSQTGSNLTTTGGRKVPTIAVPYNPATAGPVLTGGFSLPKTQAPLPQPAVAARLPQPRPANPYMMSTGGANALSIAPIARLPQPRPAYPAVVSAPTAALPGRTMMQQLADQMRRAEAVAAQVGARVADAYSQGMRSGMGYSGSTYSGGTYGGAGGRSIASGVGGAFRNR